MSALNKKASPVVMPIPKGLSGNGNIQYVKNSKTMLLEIATSVLYGKDQFYNTADQLYQNMKSAVNSLVLANEFDYIANVCLFARKVMDMRTYPIAIVVEFANALAVHKKSYANMRNLVKDVISRGDELTELYGYSLTIFGNKKCVPMAIKKGVADAFNKFDAYQFAKYNGGSKSLTIKDLMRIVHPVPVDTVHNEIFSKIMTDTLESPYTWEVEFSKNGQLPLSQQKKKSVIWDELINSGKLGYMAMLRNLRNIEQECSSQTIVNVAKFISDPEKIKRSKQLPMAYITAKENVSTLVFKQALDEAIELSFSNVPNLGNRICIVIDNSGSMGGKAIDTAVLFAAAINAAHSASTVEIVSFGNTAGFISNPTSLTNMAKMKHAINLAGHCGGTNFSSVTALIGNRQYDAMFILSDGDVSKTDLSKADKLGGKGIKVIFNFNASPTTPFRKGNSFFICGLSGKIFSFLKYVNEVGSISELLSCGYGNFPVN